MKDPKKSDIIYVLTFPYFHCFINSVIITLYFQKVCPIFVGSVSYLTLINIPV